MLFWKRRSRRKIGVRVRVDVITHLSGKGDVLVKAHYRKSDSICTRIILKLCITREGTRSSGVRQAYG